MKKVDSKLLNWSTGYCLFDRDLQINIPIIERVASGILAHYYQNMILDKPIYYHSNNQVRIVIHYFNRSGGSRPRIERSLRGIKDRFTVGSLGSSYLNQWSPLQIENQLGKLFGKKVQIDLIRSKQPYLNSTILAKYINAEAGGYSIAYIFGKVMKKVKWLDSSGGRGISNDWNGLVREQDRLRDGIVSNLTGVKLVVSGGRRGGSRTITWSHGIGSFNFNSQWSLIDRGLIVRKDKNGSIGIKVFITTEIKGKTNYQGERG